MNLISNLLSGIISIYIWVLIISSLFSIFSPYTRHPLLDFAYSIINPPLAYIRKNMPFVIQGNIDFSPFILILALELIRSVI